MSLSQSPDHRPVTSPSTGSYLTNPSQAHPTINVIAVIGSPTRKYSQKPIFTSGLAFSTTIMFAMLPVIVRLPANVDAIARTSHAACGFGKFGTNDLRSITAGTLLTILLSSDTTIVNTPGRCRFQCSATHKNFPTIHAFCAPPTIKKSPIKNSKRPQSTSSYNLRARECG